MVVESEMNQDYPHLREVLTAYCFGRLPDEDRDAVEQHLMECDVCWGEFQRLDAAVRTLRFDAALGPVLPVNEVVSLLGLSSRLSRLFGGHATIVWTLACLYGLEWTIGLWSELGYAYDRFGALARMLSFPVAGWVVATVLVALSIDTATTRAGRSNGLARSIAVVLSSLAVLVACLMVLLPSEQTIRASFQTRTAGIGYLKDAGLLFLPLLLFVAPPFHTLIRLQRELKAGRADAVLNLLSKGQESLVPRGMWYLSPRFLIGFLFAAGTLRVVGTNYMLDGLKPGPYANLFSLAAYISVGVWFAIGVVSLVWYSRGLNELRREATLLAALSKQTPDGRHLDGLNS